MAVITAAGGYGQWLLSTTDVNGQTTSYQYDVLGRLTAVVRPLDSSGSPSATSTYTNTCTNGGTTPCLEIDTATRTTVGGPTTTMQQWYDGWGHLIETQVAGPSSGTNLLTYSVYDALGRETTRSLPYSVTSGQGYLAPDLTKPRTVTNYDALGRSLGSVTYSDATTIVLSTTLSYTVAQGVSGISSESGNAYAQTIALDAYNHQSITYTDTLDRTRYAQVFSGTSAPYSVVRTTGNTYDLLGDTTSVQTYDSSATIQATYTATFDALKRLTGYNDSDLGACTNTPMPTSCSGSTDTAWKLTYDDNNNMLSQTDPRNKSVYASYDGLNRLLCRGTTSASVNPCQSSAYETFFYSTYTNVSNPGVTFPSGCVAPGTSFPIEHLTAETFSGTAGSGWRCFGYDQRGRTDQSGLSVTADSQTTTQTVSLSYNDTDQLTGLVYPDGETLTSQYDVNGRFQSAYFGTPASPDPVNFLVGQTGYTANGQLSSLAIGGSGPKASVPTPVFSIAMGYDGIQRPLSVTGTKGGTTFWNQTRTYDNVGNVLGLTSTVPTTSGGTQTDVQSFCYDALNRLQWAGNTGTPTGGDHCGNAPTGTTLSTYQQSLSYDDLDRLITGPAGSMAYDSTHVHAAATLSTVPNQYAAYDAMGNMTCRNIDTTSGHTCAGGTPTGATMTYDNAGRLDTWTAPSGTTASDQFLYDNNGNRVLQRTNVSSTITDTIYFDGYTETNISGGTTTTTKFYSAGGQTIAMNMSNAIYYLLADFLNSSDVVLNSDGSLKAAQLFAPYGTVRYSQGTMPTTHNFAGQRLDSQTGLLYYNFRYYDPVSGRFTRADTEENNTSGMDPYGYVGGNPETRNDPTGHGWLFNIATTAAVIGLGVAATALIVPMSPILAGVAVGIATGYAISVAFDFIDNGGRLPDPQDEHKWEQWGQNALINEFAGAVSAGISSAAAGFTADARYLKYGTRIALDTAKTSSAFTALWTGVLGSAITVGGSRGIKELTNPAIPPSSKPTPTPQGKTSGNGLAISRNTPRVHFNDSYIRTSLWQNSIENAWSNSQRSISSFEWHSQWNWNAVKMGNMWRGES